MRSRPSRWVVGHALGSLVLLAAAVSPAAIAQSPSPDPVEPPASGSLTYPLQGTRWRLESHALDGEIRSVGPEIDAWLRIGSDRATGSTGCTRFDVVAQIPYLPSRPAEPVTTSPPFDESIRFADIQTGDRACAEQRMLVATSVVEGLARTAGYRLHHAAPAWASTLELVDVDAQPLLSYRVDDAGSLTGTTWLLDSLDGAPAVLGVDGQQIVLALDEAPRDSGDAGAARVSGSTGCRSFSATYSATGNVLSIGELSSTDGPCSPDLTEQDVVVRGILDATSLAVALPPGALELTSADDGRTLRYRPAAGLEEHAWVLARRDADRLGGDEVVTLLLAPDQGSSPEDPERAGTVSGQGPCRAYEGRYRTDGLLVAFEDVEPDRGTCASEGAERGWERRLRRAILAEVDAGRLRLRDRYGSILATLESPALP